MKAFKGGWGQCKTNLNQASELSEDGAVGMNIYPQATFLRLQMLLCSLHQSTSIQMTQRV